MTSLRARWAALSPATRLRAIGVAVLVLGIAGAAVFYVIQARSAPPPLDELVPGYARERTHEISNLMGPMGAILSGWMDALDEPAGQAIVIAGLAAMASAICFRVAWLKDHEG